MKGYGILGALSAGTVAGEVLGGACGETLSLAYGGRAVMSGDGAYVLLSACVVAAALALAGAMVLTSALPFSPALPCSRPLFLSRRLSLPQSPLPQLPKGRAADGCLVAALFLAGLCRGLSWSLCGGGGTMQEWGIVVHAHEALVRAVSGTGFSQQASALAKALLCGDRGDIDPQVRAAFRMSGASHILALSGLHLGIIYGMVSRVLGVAGGNPVAVRLRGCVIILLCGVYAVVTGGSPSIVRAFLFILLRECALMTGRVPLPGVGEASVGSERAGGSGSGSIFASALMIHLFLSPGSVASSGFQLSYLAMCGIYLLYPRLEAIYPRRRGDPVKKVWDIAVLSLSCQAFTAPVAWLHFRSFPQWFLLTNLIAMPLSTALIVCAVPAVLLLSLGLRVHVLTAAVDLLARALAFSLTVIAGM